MTEHDAEMLRNFYAGIVMHALIGRGRFIDMAVKEAFHTADQMLIEATEHRPNSDGTNHE
jgi:hypothetical protein